MDHFRHERERLERARTDAGHGEELLEITGAALRRRSEARVESPEHDVGASDLVMSG
jgi:hypothetical protein